MTTVLTQERTGKRRSAGVSRRGKPLRMALARALARAFIIAGRTRIGRRLIIALREVPPLRRLLNRLLAFHGSFGSLREAEECVVRYASSNGHENERLTASQIAAAENTRASDYPVLFHLVPIAGQLRSAFDFGGSVGNLFYVLTKHLRFADDLVWTVHDFPGKRPLAQALAREKGEDRIAFAEDFEAASGADLLIAVGSVHYFEDPLPDLLRRLERLPTHVMINRTPFFTGRSITGVHDNGDWIIPCKLHDADRIVGGMAALGYELVAEWFAHERIMQIPLYPEYHEPYKGFYFRLRSAALSNSAG
ncbi:MAG TPA: methyltransferase, TIGR04325 family [Pseudolabrys sp.]|nr:methyltransferase, TIGR04325 family [Pseudolabrys sp.]